MVASTSDNGVRYALETRADVLKLLSGDNLVRRGESDRTEIGSLASLDGVDGAETVHVGGNLTEKTGRQRMLSAARVRTTVNGHLETTCHGDMTLLGGAMSESYAGAVLLLAGMSDNIVVGGGARVTAPADLWLNYLAGIEEKIGTAAADGVLVEVYGTHFEREYGPGVYAVGSALFTGTVCTTTATGFRPLSWVASHIRDLSAGGGGGGAEAPPPPPPSPPPIVAGAAAVAAGAGSMVHGGVRAGRAASTFGSLGSLASARHIASVEDLHHAEDAASVLEDARTLANAMQAGEDVSSGGDSAAALARLEGLADAQQSQSPGTRTMFVYNTDGTVRIDVQMKPQDWDDPDWMKYLGPQISQADADDARHLDAPSDGVMLPAGFDREGALKRLDQEIALQNDELLRLRADPNADPGDIRRVEAEIDARQLAKAEIEAGRDPRPALLARAEAMGDTEAAAAYRDTAAYYGGSGAFKSAAMPEISFADLLAEWRSRIDEADRVADGLRPRTPEAIERAEAFADVTGYMRQALIDVTNGRDPRDELLRHAENLEARQFEDGGTGAAEASMLRTMAAEYTETLEDFQRATAAVTSLTSGTSPSLLRSPSLVADLPDVDLADLADDVPSWTDELGKAEDAASGRRGDTKRPSYLEDVRPDLTSVEGAPTFRIVDATGEAADTPAQRLEEFSALGDGASLNSYVESPYALPTALDLDDSVTTRSVEFEEGTYSLVGPDSVAPPGPPNPTPAAMPQARQIESTYSLIEETASQADVAVDLEDVRSQRIYDTPADDAVPASTAPVSLDPAGNPVTFQRTPSDTTYEYADGLRDTYWEANKLPGDTPPAPAGPDPAPPGGGYETLGEYDEGDKVIAAIERPPEPVPGRRSPPPPPVPDSALKSVSDIDARPPAPLPPAAPASPPPADDVIYDVWRKLSSKYQGVTPQPGDPNRVVLGRKVPGDAPTFFTYVLQKIPANQADDFEGGKPVFLLPKHWNEEIMEARRVLEIYDPDTMKVLGDSDYIIKFDDGPPEAVDTSADMRLMQGLRRDSHDFLELVEAQRANLRQMSADWEAAMAPDSALRSFSDISTRPPMPLPPPKDTLPRKSMVGKWMLNGGGELKFIGPPLPRTK